MARSDGGAYRRYSDSLPFEKAVPAPLGNESRSGRSRYLATFIFCVAFPFLLWQYIKNPTKSNLLPLVLFPATFLVYLTASVYERFVDNLDVERQEEANFGAFLKSFF